MASIRKHGDGYQTRYYTNGVRQHETFTSLEAAQIRAKEVELAQAKGATVEAHPQRVKFWELAKAVVQYYDVNELRSRDDIECRYRVHLIPFFGNRKAVTINGAMIGDYIALRKSEGASNATVNRELEAMKRAFKLGVQQETFPQVPYIPHLKESNVRTGFFTRPEVDRLCAHLPEPLGRFVLFAFLTAWRCDEIRNLKWSNVDFERGEIRLEPGTTKTDAGRVFPLTSELRSLIGVPKIRTIVNFPWVFERRQQQVKSFRKTWARACMAAGLPCTIETEIVTVKAGPRKGEKRTKITRITAKHLFHDLRRSGVRELAKILGEKRAMQRTGHKSRSVFDRYSIVSDFDLTEDRKLLEAGAASRTSTGE